MTDTISVETKKDEKQKVIKILNSLNSMFTTVKNIDKTWNIKEGTNVLSNWNSISNELQLESPVLLNELSQNICIIKEYLVSPDYKSTIEDSFRGRNLPFYGEYPNYELPPYRINISVENSECRLIIGRKSERTNNLNPTALTKWIESHYTKIITRKFDTKVFLKDLKNAYEICLKILFGHNNVKWGTAINIGDIYEKLTVRSMSKQEYPKQIFSYDIGRLREEPNIEMDGCRYEFGFARNQSRAIVIIDSIGRESRISSLTIYNNTI